MKARRLNYSTHALADLLTTQRKGIHRFDRRFLGWVSHHLYASVKFQLPTNGELLTDVTDLSDSLRNLIRPPFPSVALEYEADVGVAKQIVTLVVDSEGSRFGLGYPEADWDRSAGYSIITSLVRHPSAGWMPGSAAIMPYNQSQHAAKRGQTKIGCIPIPHIYADQRDILRAFGDLNVYIQRTASEMYLDLNAIANLALCSMCENVEAEVIQPPKAASLPGAKRRAAPFFEVRMLHLRAGATEQEGDGSGTHASPKLHLRRGHIRRLGDGRLTWVRNAIVGDKTKGLISKSYDVRT